MITLPHTGLQVPHNRVGCDDYTSILDQDDEAAFSLTLTVDGHPAGEITDHGTGGAIIYQPGPSGLFSHHDLTAFAAACRTPAGRTPTETHVLELLTEEYVIDALLAEAQRDGATLARHTHPDENREGETYTCGDVHQLDPAMTHRTPAERENLAHLLNRYTTCHNPTWQIWRNHAWTPLLTIN